MKRTQTIINWRIFLASPNDMQPHRDTVAAIAKKLNDGFLDREQLTLRIVTAQDDVYATYGKDPQFIINEQVADEHEVIIVLFGCRIGNETPRALAGTIEEFKRAARRHKKTGKPNIMIYFCRDQVDPFEIDAKQLELVHRFRDSISDKSFWKTFTSETFADVLEKDLKLYLRKILDSPPVKKMAGDADLSDLNN